MHVSCLKNDHLLKRQCTRKKGETCLLALVSKAIKRMGMESDEGKREASGSRLSIKAYLDE